MNKKSRNTIIGSAVVVVMAIIAAIVVSGVSFWNGSMNSEAAGRPVTIDSVTIQGTDVVAQVSCKSIPSSDDGVFYLFGDVHYFHLKKMLKFYKLPTSLCHLSLDIRK